MASSSNSDFLHWHDINLDVLLEEYTCEDSSSSSSDEDFCVEQQKKKQKPNGTDQTKHRKQPIYECDVCEKTYMSISGIRGHMRAKHGLQNVKASNYRKDNKTREPTKPHFEIDKKFFIQIFEDTFKDSLENIKQNKFRNIKSSVHGNKIIQMASHVQTNNQKLEKIQSLLKPVYTDIFSAVTDCDTSTKETLFSSFYEKTNETNLVEALTEILAAEIEDVKFVRPFIGILNRQLLADLVKKRTELYNKSEASEEQQLTETDQKVIYYICGYILAALSKVNRKNSTLQAAIQTLLNRNDQSEKSFVDKYSAWTRKEDRGGLKYPSDNFFFFIRACELCIRKQEANTSSTERTVILESLMENHAVKFYSEKLADGSKSSRLVEKCISLFLTIRGHAVARKIRNENSMEVKTQQSTKSLRGVLKDKTNKKA